MRLTLRGETPEYLALIRRTLEGNCEPEPNTGCLLWTGLTTDRGYGRMRVGNQDLAHRVSYMLNVGNIPDGCHVCHLCETPSCINPDHLVARSPAWNIWHYWTMRGHFLPEPPHRPRKSMGAPKRSRVRNMSKRAVARRAGIEARCNAIIALREAHAELKRRMGIE